MSGAHRLDGRPRAGRLRVAVHYAAMIAVLALYGIRVSPVLAGLAPSRLLAPLLAAAALQYLLHHVLQRRYVVTAPHFLQVTRLFQIETLLFLVSALAVSGYYALVFGLPPAGGLKLVLGFTVLGLLVASDLALAWEGRLIACLGAGQPPVAEAPYVPLARKISVFACTGALAAGTVVFLLIDRDLDGLRVAGDESLFPVRQAVLADIAGTVLVFLLYVLNVVGSFARNLRLFFDRANTVLARGARGLLEGSVPVASADELGLLGHRTNRMVEGVRALVDELQRTQDAAVMSLAALVESRDRETAAHLLRVQRYVRVLAEQLRGHPRFRAELGEPDIELLFRAAPLHDIGKVGIPDHILSKPGRLSAAEFETMKAHTVLGGEALRMAEQEIGSSAFLRVARELVTTHHERWDGGGYPAGLRGEEIPVSGRLMALADVYDALITERPYKPAFSHAEARAIILEGRDRHFDPAVVDAFVTAEDEFVRIAARYPDEPHPLIRPAQANRA